MSRSLALTGIALFAASAVAGCGGSVTPLADGSGPGARHGAVLAPRPGNRHHRSGLRPGCKRVPGGLYCSSRRGTDRDFMVNDVDGGVEPDDSGD